MLLGLLNEGIFLGDFLNISFGPPFALFQKVRGLGDLAKIVVTWPFGHFWSRGLRQNPFQSLHFKCILLMDNAIGERVLMGLLSEGYLLRDF